MTDSESLNSGDMTNVDLCRDPSTRGGKPVPGYFNVHFLVNRLAPNGPPSHEMAVDSPSKFSGASRVATRTSWCLDETWQTMRHVTASRVAATALTFSLPGARGLVFRRALTTSVKGWIPSRPSNCIAAGNAMALAHCFQNHNPAFKRHGAWFWDRRGVFIRKDHATLPTWNGEKRPQGGVYPDSANTLFHLRGTGAAHDRLESLESLESLHEWGPCIEVSELPPFVSIGSET